MDRYPDYQSMLARVEHKKMQVKGQLAPEQYHLIDGLVAFVLDQFRNMSTADADTAQDHLLSVSNGPVARALANDTRIDMKEQTNSVNAQVDHRLEVTSGSISNGQSASSVALLPMSHSAINANIKLEIKDAPSGQSSHLCVKKKEDGEELHCDCGCEEGKVKLEIMKDELDDESDQSELDRINIGQPVPVTRTIMRESQSASIQQHNLMESIKVIVHEEEHSDEDCDCPECVVKLDSDEGEQMDIEREETVKRQRRERINDGLIQSNSNDGGEETQVNVQSAPNGDDQADGQLLTDAQVNIDAGALPQPPMINQAGLLGFKYKCYFPRCGKGFNSKSTFNVHTRTHSGYKPFKCPWVFCDKEFAKIDSLRNHMLTHTDERAHACGWPDCGKRFVRKYDLTRHFKRVHQ